MTGSFSTNLFYFDLGYDKKYYDGLTITVDLLYIEYGFHFKRSNKVRYNEGYFFRLSRWGGKWTFSLFFMDIIK